MAAKLFPTINLSPAIATMALGSASAGHSLLEKIRIAALHSFKGVEVYFGCLEAHAYVTAGVVDHQSLLQAAVETKEVCDQNGIFVVCLQPFLFFDGLTSDSARIDAFKRLRLWFNISHALGTDLIQIPTNFQQHDTTGDLGRIVEDLKEAAALGLKESPPIRLAYEGVSWGTHIDTWETTWEVVKRVNMSNLGICIDTFHIAARVWGDPTSAFGCLKNGEAGLTATLERMIQELNPQKIFYIQIGDAEKLSPPLGPGHEFWDEKMPPRMSWSRNSRLFPFENQGYLPIGRILAILVQHIGYCGWASMEIFNRKLFGGDPAIPEQYARRAKQSWALTIRFLEKEHENDRARQAVTAL
ncbi:xylose isomerase-like TIM barrel domain-containing protein [Trichoderma breve]|uniref:Xylose isomerase-like TIM barrel domain-containing protein n=1 Tax=Trichoderma breve TaxID=2034170 RepID=A0A9W9B8R5_9HYPO|nr:xylose isomerase-like TIM barrel domain-containing protein [Trichoderma breve]KAJ4856794.1 xylose isomerase-like TIM barrel domain-containing protein [Trichoderma breve]